MISIVEKLNRPHLTPVVKVNIIVTGQTDTCVFQRNALRPLYVVFLPKVRNLNLIVRKQVDKLKLGTVYEITGLILSKCQCQERKRRNLKETIEINN